MRHRTYVLFTSEGMAADAANGGWFIPPVVSIIIPLTLIPLLPHVGDSAARLLLLAGYAGRGVGLFLFLLVAAVLFGRLVFHPLPPAPLVPSLWIGLGPIGVGSLALLRLAAAGQPYWGDQAAAVERISTLLAAVLWGFGLWWLATAAILLTRYLRHGRLPYGVGLWAFTFPLGAYTVATLQLARSWPSHPLEWAAAGPPAPARRLLGHRHHRHPARDRNRPSMAAVAAARRTAERVGLPEKTGKSESRANRRSGVVPLPTTRTSD